MLSRATVQTTPARVRRTSVACTGRMVADPPGLEEGSESAIDAAIRTNDRRQSGGDVDDDVGEDGSPVDDGQTVEDLRRELRRTRQRAEDRAEGRASELEGRTAEALDSVSTANLNTLKTARSPSSRESRPA